VVGVTVIAYAGLLIAGTDGRDFCVTREVDLADEAATVGDLLSLLSVNKGELGVIVIDGRLAHETEPMHDGDRVRLYPFFGGG
jgi:sulfur carrier protein ThiS